MSYFEKLINLAGNTHILIPNIMGVQIKNGLLNYLRSFIIKHLMLNFLRELTTGIVFTYVSRSLKSELCLNNVSLIYRRTVQPYLIGLGRTIIVNAKR